MAIIDDLVASGLSLAQAQQVIAADGGNNTANLVAAGFTYTEAVGITALNAGTNTANNLTVQGLWAGTQVPAITAALAVTP